MRISRLRICFSELELAPIFERGSQADRLTRYNQSTRAGGMFQRSLDLPEKPKLGKIRSSVV